MRKKRKIKIDEIVGDSNKYEEMDEKEYIDNAKKATKAVCTKNRVITTLVLVGIMIGLVIYSLVDSYKISNKNRLGSLLMYQQELYGDIVMEDVRTMLGVYNEETYQNAKKSLALHSELQEKYFGKEHYNEDSVSEPPVVSILNLEYNLSDDINDKVFLVTAEKRQGNRGEFYKVIVELYNDEIYNIWFTKV